MKSLVFLVLTVFGDNVEHVNSNGWQIGISYTQFTDMETCEAARPMLQANAEARIRVLLKDEWLGKPQVNISSACIELANSGD